MCHLTTDKNVRSSLTVDMNLFQAVFREGTPQYQLRKAEASYSLQDPDNQPSSFLYLSFYLFGVSLA